GLEEIAVASLAKRFEEVYVPDRVEPVRIPRDSEALYLLQQVRDEAHRFAITYHRQLRDKKMTKSVIDDIPGLGPARRRRLLAEFGSVRRVRAASEEQLLGLPWLTDAVARPLCARLHGAGPRRGVPRRHRPAVVPRRRRRGAGPALRGDPPPPSAGFDRRCPRRHRARARAARGVQGPCRPRRRHDELQRARAPRAARRPVRWRRLRGG